MRNALCLKMGSLSLAPCIPIYPEDGALWITFPSVSVSRSRELPGPEVPGFQNLSPPPDMVMSALGKMLKDFGAPVRCSMDFPL